MIETVFRLTVPLMFFFTSFQAPNSDCTHGMPDSIQPPCVLSGKDALVPVLEDLPRRISLALEKDRLAGISMAVVLERDVVFCEAFGYANLEQHIPASPETIYPAGSITKVFTAMMLSRLCEKGIVNLEDPVEKYLPEYKPKSPYAGIPPTTLRQLAAHTSGLPPDAPVNFWCDYSGFLWLVTGGQVPLMFYASRDTLLASLADIELVHPPEIYAHYSNLNIQVLGLALERVCGRPFEDYIEHEILDPLGMKDTRFSLDPDQRKRLATGYVCTGPEAEVMAAPEYELGCAVYSGGLFSTAGDLARFLINQWPEDRETGNGVLSRGSLRRMRTPQSIHRPAVHSSYGLGWGVVRMGDQDAIEHNGALPGYHAHISAVPDLGLGIVVLSNSKNFLWRPEACKDLARAVLEDLIRALISAEQGTESEPSAVECRAYEGCYALPGGVAHLSVRSAESGLEVALVEDTGFSERFIPVGPHAFCFQSDPGRVPVMFFESGPDGEISAVTFLGHRFGRQHPDR